VLATRPDLKPSWLPPSRPACKQHWQGGGRTDLGKGRSLCTVSRPVSHGQHFH
jgi:hypothetical protein